MGDRAGFEATIDSIDGLRALYREPSSIVTNKDSAVLDAGCETFIAASTFVLVATSDRAGNLDVSPRGGPAGFVKVLDERRLAIPDLNGNNRLDSLSNIVENGQVSLLFLIPGLGETLRVNGSACVTTDDAVLDLFAQEVRRPKTAIGVTIDVAFVHCAKSIRRGSLWEPDAWPASARRPSVPTMLIDHTENQGVITPDELGALLEAGYEADLAEDAP